MEKPKKVAELEKKRHIHKVLMDAKPWLAYSPCKNWREVFDLCFSTIQEGIRLSMSSFQKNKQKTNAWAIPIPKRFDPKNRKYYIMKVTIDFEEVIYNGNTTKHKFFNTGSNTDAN